MKNIEPTCSSVRYTDYGAIHREEEEAASVISLKQVKEPARLPYCYYHNSTRCFSWGDELDPGIQKSSNIENPMPSLLSRIIVCQKPHEREGWAGRVPSYTWFVSTLREDNSFHEVRGIHSEPLGLRNSYDMTVSCSRPGLHAPDVRT